MGFVEGMELTVGYVQQLLATGMLGFRVDDVIDLECLCARPFRIAEYVQLADVQAFDKGAGIFEIGIRFASRTDNHIDADKGVWHDLFDLFDLMPEQGSVVTTAHEFQYIVASALQRDMEMGSEMFAMCHKIDRFVCDQIRFDGRDAVADDPFHLVECPDQIDKRLPGTLPEVPILTPVNTISFPPLAATSSACFTMLAIVPLRLRPRAKGMVQ